MEDIKMNKEQQIVSKLKSYAAVNIHNIAEQNKLLKSIDDISITFVDDVNSTKAISQQDAILLTQYLYWNPEKGGIEKTIGEPIDQETYQKMRKLARIVIELAVKFDDQKTHTDIVEISNYLHPLYSRDYRTIELGFELREHTDFFIGLAKSERKKFGKKLLDEWKDTNYID